MAVWGRWSRQYGRRGARVGRRRARWPPHPGGQKVRWSRCRGVLTIRPRFFCRLSRRVAPWSIPTGNVVGILSRWSRRLCRAEWFPWVVTRCPPEGPSWGSARWACPPCVGARCARTWRSFGSLWCFGGWGLVEKPTCWRYGSFFGRLCNPFWWCSRRTVHLPEVGVATPLWAKCEGEAHTPKSGNLESFGTPENSELELKGQNTLHWGVLSVIRKVFKCRCLNWPRIGHLDICSPSYGQKKGRKSNW